MATVTSEITIQFEQAADIVFTQSVTIPDSLPMTLTALDQEFRLWNFSLVDFPFIIEQFGIPTGFSETVTIAPTIPLPAAVWMLLGALSFLAWRVVRK